MNTFKTKKGTELPLLDLRGKPYLQIAHRLVWFREEHPDWGVETEIRGGENCCTAKATIRDASGKIMATAHKFEDSKGFGDYLEKAETGAIGRALGLCGYGTQFAPEFDEGERLADSPVQPAKPSPSPVQPLRAPVAGKPVIAPKGGWTPPPDNWNPLT